MQLSLTFDERFQLRTRQLAFLRRRVRCVHGWRWRRKRRNESAGRRCGIGSIQLRVDVPMAEERLEHAVELIAW